ncbi:uncharacterized protein LOC111495991 isoform X1 [Cucurbita maxima]|uniref:Uncharacterized protein LOC111495991 isoform X1 n=1 Tax=Cucurbita maxima TaxID=3661 RepID=A0A6J1KP41_CUCMA|nr:uncharacterized protein LOC111495991 isoform X1 [Cucurbita maxima]
MAIQFKFRSSVIFDSVDIDGRPSISIGDLKSKIIRMKNLDTCQNFDLVFSDARTGQDLVDEKFEIPSGSCVIIKRVPAGSVPSNVVHHDLFGKFQVKDTDMVNSSRPVEAETDNFDDFGVDLYPIRKKTSSLSLNHKKYDAVRHYKETERGYIEPEGSGISEAIQRDSSHGTTVGGTELQTNIKVHIGEGIGLEKPVVAMASVNHDCEIPPELKCTLCKSLFVDAVIIGCCKHSFCEKCIHHVLLRKAKCPNCASTKYRLENLLPNLSLRQNVADFLESQILMGNPDNAIHHDAPDEESRIEGEDMPFLSYATSRGCNQAVVEDINDSSLKRNMVDGALFGSGHPEKFGGMPQDLPPFDDCQGESQPVFGDFKHGLLINASDIPGKIQNLADFRRQKKRCRACYMCGSLDHLIRDCPVASKPHPMHLMGATPYYASPWHHVSSFSNLYGCTMPFNTSTVPEANSYWASLYGGYPAPSGYVGMRDMTAPPLRKIDEFCGGYSQSVDVSDTNKRGMIPDNRTRRAMTFINEDGCEGEDNVAKNRGLHEWDGRSRDYRMLEEKEHPRRETAKDEINWLYDEKRKSSRSSKDAMINQFNGRLGLDTEGLPCNTKLLTKERSEHHHRSFREVGGRTDECCSHFSSNHHKKCKLKEDKTNMVEFDLKRQTKKHPNDSKFDLEQSFPRSRGSKHNALTQDHHRQMVCEPNDDRVHKYNKEGSEKLQI